MSARIQSIERAAAVLRLLTGRSRRRGVADLADELDLPKGTVHGILRTLKAVGFVEQDHELQKLEVGRSMPLHATALGKALLAHDRAVASDLASGGLVRYTSATVTDHGRLAEQLDMISDRGWADEVAEFLPGVASIAAPIQGHSRAVLGAIALAGPVERICDGCTPRADLVGHVMESALRVSRELGGGAW